MPPEGDRPVTAWASSLTKHRESWPRLPFSPIPGPGSDCRQSSIWPRIHLEPLLSSRNSPLGHHKLTSPTVCPPQTLVGKESSPLWDVSQVPFKGDLINPHQNPISRCYDPHFMGEIEVQGG